jgi:two-component system, sensor histidine kinase and response regulator
VWQKLTPRMLDTASGPWLRLRPVPASAKQQEILVVDDKAENCALAGATLEDEGYAVRVAMSGHDALRMFHERRPDCVLLDARMPGMDGFEVCQRLRTAEGGPITPVIFLTALRDVDTFDRALRSGADDFLVKPIRPEELTVRIQTALKLGRMSAELRELYEVVRKQRDDLMRMQLQKDRLTSFIVHDLKNPAGAVDLHAQLILRDPQLSARAKESAQRIREEVQNLARLLMNLLDLGRGEQGELAPKRAVVELEPLVLGVVSSFEARARTEQVSLRVELAAGSVWADPELLQRALENLVDNALRHAPEHSAITLSSRRLEGAVEIRVRDTGPGIARELRERVFEPYVQLERDEPAALRAGRGLGLTFCKVAVQAHGGAIWIDDAGPGATFCLRLPDAD